MRLHLLVPCLLMVACVNVDSDFNDYIDRTNGLRGPQDTGPTDTAAIDAQPGADINGTFLMSCLPTLAAGDASKSLLFYATITFDTSARKFDVTANPIKAVSTTFTLADTDAANALSASAIPVATDGTWSVDVPGTVDIPGDADRLLNGAEITITDVSLAGGHVLSADLLCNDLHGTGQSPIPNNPLGSGNFCVWKRLKEGDPLPTFSAGGSSFVGYDLSEYHCP